MGIMNFNKLTWVSYLNNKFHRCAPRKNQFTDLKKTNLINYCNQQITTRKKKKGIRFKPYIRDLDVQF